MALGLEERSFFEGFGFPTTVHSWGLVIFFAPLFAVAAYDGGPDMVMMGIWLLAGFVVVLAKAFAWVSIFLVAVSRFAT